MLFYRKCLDDIIRNTAAFACFELNCNLNDLTQFNGYQFTYVKSRTKGNGYAFVIVMVRFVSFSAYH